MKKLSDIEEAAFILRESDMKENVKPIDRLPEPSAEYLGSAFVIVSYNPDQIPANTYKCVKDGSGYKWIRINYSEEDCLAAPTNLWANAKRDENTGRATVRIHWKDPDDTDTAHWAYSVVVRKCGSKPTSIYDGEIVGYSSIRNQYAYKEGMIDSIDAGNVDESDIIDTDDGSGAIDEDYLYYYNVFAVTVYGKVSFDFDQACGPTLTWKKFSELIKLGIVKYAIDLGDIVEIVHEDFGKICFQTVAFNNARVRDPRTGLPYTPNSVTFMACDVLFRGSFDHKELNLAPTQDTMWDASKTYFDSDGTIITDRSVSIASYNSNPNTGTVCEKNPAPFAPDRGCNAWDVSNARSWLNGVGNNWFTPRTIFDQYSTNFTYDGTYGTKDKQFGGFLGGMPDDLREVLATCVVRTTVPTWRNGDGTTYEETDDVIFLPSYVELFGVDRAFPTGVCTLEGTQFDIYKQKATNTRMKLMLGDFDTTSYNILPEKAKSEADCLASWYMRTPVHMVDVELGTIIDCIEIVTAKNRRFDANHELGEDGGAGRQCYEPAGDKASTNDSERDSRANFFTPVGSNVRYCNNTAAGFVPCFVVI